MKAAPDCVTTELKKFHGIMPVNKKTAKVFKSVLNKAEKMTAITDIINSGLMSVHRYPKTVRRYRRINCCPINRINTWR